MSHLLTYSKYVNRDTDIFLLKMYERTMTRRSDDQTGFNQTFQVSLEDEAKTNGRIITQTVQYKHQLHFTGRYTWFNVVLPYLP